MVREASDLITLIREFLGHELALYTHYLYICSNSVVKARLDMAEPAKPSHPSTSRFLALNIITECKVVTSITRLASRLLKVIVYLRIRSNLMIHARQVLLLVPNHNFCNGLRQPTRI